MPRMKDAADDDAYYPPEVAAARMDALLRACAGIPPKDAAEAALRADIARTLDGAK